MRVQSWLGTSLFPDGAEGDLVTGFEAQLWDGYVAVRYRDHLIGLPWFRLHALDIYAAAVLALAQTQWEQVQPRE